jgi:RNA polymerase-associated protein CTR9
LKIQAEELAAARRESRLKAQEWTRDIRMESDEEKERKPKKARRIKVEGASGDEGELQQPKKKRRGKLKKNGESGGDEGALFTDEEGGEEKPAKKVWFSVYALGSHSLILLLQRPTKKRVVRDEDEGEQLAAPRKKQ